MLAVTGGCSICSIMMNDADAVATATDKKLRKIYIDTSTVRRKGGARSAKAIEVRKHPAKPD
jgi:hypothetical protein